MTNQDQSRQPVSLYFLSLTELWERYGFYTVQALFVLYLTNSLHFTDKHSYALYTAFTGLLYASPVIGGFLADRWAGFQKAVLFGTLLYIAGYIFMLSHNRYGFFFALALLVCAMGFFKASISSLLGTLYDKDDPRRDSGFTIFYLGINIGVFTAPIISSLIARHFGYQIGFASAGIGMVFSLCIFLLAKKRLGDHGALPLTKKTLTKSLQKKQGIIYATTLLVAIGLSFIIDFPEVIVYSIAAFSIAAILYVLNQTVKYKSSAIRKRIIALLVLFVFSTLFWAYYMLSYSVLTLFAERSVNRVLFGWNVPAAMLSGIQGLTIIIMAPIFAKIWMKTDKSPYHPTYGLKFAFGHFFQGAAFLLLVLGCYFHNTQYQVSTLWIFVFYFTRALGELSLSPIGLAAVTQLSPKKLVGTMMGIFFLTIAGGSILSNYLDDMAIVPKGVTNSKIILGIYNHAFIEYALVSIGVN